MSKMWGTRVARKVPAGRGRGPGTKRVRVRGPGFKAGAGGNGCLARGVARLAPCAGVQRATCRGHTSLRTTATCQLHASVKSRDLPPSSGDTYHCDKPILANVWRVRTPVTWQLSSDTAICQPQRRYLSLQETATCPVLARAEHRYLPPLSGDIIIAGNSDLPTPSVRGTPRRANI